MNDFSRPRFPWPHCGVYFVVLGVFYVLFFLWEAINLKNPECEIIPEKTGTLEISNRCLARTPEATFQGWHPESSTS